MKTLDEVYHLRITLPQTIIQERLMIVTCRRRMVAKWVIEKTVQIRRTGPLRLRQPDRRAAKHRRYFAFAFAFGFGFRGWVLLRRFVLGISAALGGSPTRTIRPLLTATKSKVDSPVGKAGVTTTLVIGKNISSTSRMWASSCHIAACIRPTRV